MPKQPRVKVKCPFCGKIFEVNNPNDELPKHNKPGHPILECLGSYSPGRPVDDFAIED